MKEWCLKRSETQQPERQRGVIQKSGLPYSPVRQPKGEIQKWIPLTVRMKISCPNRSETQNPPDSSYERMVSETCCVSKSKLCAPIVSARPLASSVSPTMAAEDMAMSNVSSDKDSRFTPIFVIYVPWSHVQDAVAGYVLRDYEKEVKYRVNKLDGFTPITLPIQDFDLTDNPVKHAIDMVAGYKDPITVQALKTALDAANFKKDWSQLPEPFGLRQEPQADTKLQIYIFEVPDGSGFMVIKHFYFPAGVLPAAFRRSIFGTSHRLRFTHPKIGTKVFQYCLDNMKGESFSMYYLGTDAKQHKTKNIMDELTDEQIDQGFEYLNTEGRKHLSIMGNARLIFITKSLRGATPIKGWPKELVREALSNLAAEGGLAKKRTNWPIVVPVHYQQWLLQILEEVWDPESKSLGLLGMTGVGKSPVGKSTLMAAVRRNKVVYSLDGVPCLRITPELDLLRGESGTLLMGDFFDDGDSNGQTIRKFKSLTDITEEETLAWARWGAVKWVKQQPRNWADNKYDPEHLPKTMYPTIEHKCLWLCARPAFDDKARKEDVDAIFKRSALIVVHKDQVVYRKAGNHEMPAPRMFINDPEFLNEKGKDLMGKLRTDATYQPPDHDENLKLERAFINKVVALRRQEQQNRAPPSSLGPRPPAAPVPSQPAEPKSTIQVKREVSAYFRFQNRSMSNVCIDLDPSPKKKALRLETEMKVELPWPEDEHKTLFGAVDVQDTDDEFDYHYQLQREINEDEQQEDDHEDSELQAALHASEIDAGMATSSRRPGAANANHDNIDDIFDDQPTPGFGFSSRLDEP
eukprot:1618475-Karenia_brevis.AAC.1